MEYQLKIKEKTYTVDLELDAEDQAYAMINDTSYELGVYRVSDHQIQMTVNGDQVNAWVEKQADGKTIIIEGQRYFIQDLAAQEMGNSSRGRESSQPQEPTTVTPPMPAIVIQVPVVVGDIVLKGDIVAIVSAMKMETSLKAPFDGKIAEIRVGEGDKVMPGDILVDIEKQPHTFIEEQRN